MSSTATELDTKTSTVKVRTKRGTFTIGPAGAINGLWPIVRRELRTAEQVRELCGFRQRGTLVRWRHDETDPFPEPVWELRARGGPVELWSRSDVEAWLEQTAGRRQPGSGRR